jgi:protein-S-isoprenylcysteine O-methyltransferase Ste14
MPLDSYYEVTMYKLLAFVLISIVLIFISRRSLRSPRSHGFYRFFAWELIVALFLLVMDAWFRDPFSWHQVVSWFLLCVSFVPLVFGVRSLARQGKPQKQRAGDPQLLAFEKTSNLVTTGIYRTIRHPMYSSLLLLTWGLFFKTPSWVGLLLAAAATLCLVLTARADEAECRRFFGSQYSDYMKRTRMFIPYLF